MTVPVPLPGVKSITLQTDRLAVHGLIRGDGGVPVVCLHGHLTTSTFYEELLLGLPDGFQGIALDLRGHGGTEPWPIDARAGCDDLVADVRAYLDTLGIGRHHLLAHGVGAAVLWRYILRFSQDIATVTAVNPAPPWGYGGSYDEQGTATSRSGMPGGAGATDPELVRRIADEDASERGPASPSALLSRWLGVRTPRDDILLDAILGIIIDEGIYPGEVLPSDVWPYHQPGAQGLMNAVCARWYDASALMHIDHKPPLLWLRGADDPVVNDAGEEDPCARGDAPYPPQPMISQMRYFLQRYGSLGGQTSEQVVPGAHLPWLSHRESFEAAWHPWLLTPTPG